MATRPCFIPALKATTRPSVDTRLIDFKWYPGYSLSQKQRCISSFHQAIKATNNCDSILEISSKSESMDGVSLSAFNLMLPLYDKSDKAIAVEVLYQGCKCFDGKPRSDSDRFDLDSRSARARAADLDAQQVFTGWFYNDSFAGLSSGTMFYDLLYLTALIYNKDLLKVLLRYDCFTDIEFNPKKSFACQARTAALAVSAESMEIKVHGLVKQIAAQIFQNNDSGRLSDQMKSDAGINQLRLF